MTNKEAQMSIISQMESCENEVTVMRLQEILDAMTWCNDVGTVIWWGYVEETFGWWLTSCPLNNFAEDIVFYLGVHPPKGNDLFAHVNAHRLDIEIPF